MTQSAAASPDAPSQRGSMRASPFVVALAGWILPGAGYVLIGHRARGLIAGGTILLTFLAGIFIGGIRVVDVPGYAEGGHRFAIGERGEKVTLYPHLQRGLDGASATPLRWALLSHPLPTILAKPWYIGHILTGPIALIASHYSLEAARNQIPKSTAHVAEFGTLYCAIAGMLNLLIIIDSGARAAGPRS